MSTVDNTNIEGIGDGPAGAESTAGAAGRAVPLDAQLAALDLEAQGSADALPRLALRGLLVAAVEDPAALRSMTPYLKVFESLAARRGRPADVRTVLAAARDLLLELARDLPTGARLRTEDVRSACRLEQLALARVVPNRALYRCGEPSVSRDPEQDAREAALLDAFMSHPAPVEALIAASGLGQREGLLEVERLVKRGVLLVHRSERDAWPPNYEDLW